MRKKIVLAAVLFLVMFQSAPAARAFKAQVLRVRDRKVISFGQMVIEISGADVILVGERHASMADHRAQLAVINSLYDQKVPLAIGLEMFRSENQYDLDKWVQGKMPLDDFLYVYYENWSAPWPLYREIFTFARDVHMPVIGLNLPSSISDKVFLSGYDSLTPAEKKEIPPGIQCTVDKEYRTFINDMYQVHHVPGEPRKSFNNFCEAQMLWDSVMAWHIVNRLQSAPGTKIVVLTGLGHAWKKGIPEQIRKRSKYSYAVVLPEMPNGKRESDITADDADYVMMNAD